MPSITATYCSLPRLAQLLIDFGVSAIALGLAYVLRFEGQIPTPYMAQLWLLLPVVLGLRLLFRTVGGLHHQLWRYVGMRDAVDVAIAVTLGTVCIVLVAKFALGIPLPWGVVAHDWWLNLVGYVGTRMLRRLHAERAPARIKTVERTRVLLVGAGQAGNMVAKEIQGTSSHLDVIGFVDDDRFKFRSRVQGVDVLGRTQDIPWLVAHHQIDEIILCTPSATEKELRRILAYCHETRAKVKTLPGLRDLITGHVELTKIREVQIEDLLNRDPITFDRAAALE